MYKVLFWTNALSYIIIGLNYVLREACIALINWIGYSTETKRLERTTMLTFYVLFLNTAFLLLIVNANMTEQPISFGLAGPISDFNSNWFRITGNTLVSTMIFNAYYPILEFFMYYGMRLFFRLLDSGWGLEKYRTKQTSIQGYIDIRAGPAYLMHFKYSTILNSIFVTFMFGFGIPILFPITAVTFFIIYVIEKASFYYSYRLPPSYDERLSQAVLSTCMWAPLFYLGFGYWMASSKQLTSNDYLQGIETASDVFESQHLMQSVFTPEGWKAPAWPMLLAFIGVTGIVLFGGILMEQFEKCIPYLKIGDLVLDEDIDNYWIAIDDNDREWSIKEEENVRNNLGGIKIMTDCSFKKLNHSNPDKDKVLKGVHSYDILANPLYL